MMDKPLELSDTDFALAAMPAFVTDANEQTRRIERLLLSAEGDSSDPQLLDELFRCAHSLKGSAGIFGVTKVVEVMHRMESLLDLLRQHHKPVTPPLGTVLLQCNDLVRQYVAQHTRAAPATAEQDLLHQHLLAQLQQFLQQAQAQLLAPAAAATTAATQEEAHAPARRWYLALRFAADAFQQGPDPLAAIAALQSLGDLITITCDRSAIPNLDALQAPVCHLAFGLCLQTAAARADIEARLAPWRQCCELHVIESASEPEHFARLIEQMPDRPRLGDILLAIGAITQPQLQATLHKQQMARVGSVEVPRLGELLLTQAGVSPDVVVAALNKQQRQLDSEDQQVLHVQTHRLDALTQLLKPLADTSQDALQIAQKLDQPALLQRLHRIASLLADMKQQAQLLRMQALSETFNHFRRVVRDASAQLGKEVVLDITGDEVEFDRTSMAKIAAALVHLVNNALDHGLERPAQRLAMGKPAQGILSLGAHLNDNEVVISVIDDGRGFDRNKILQQARKKGLIAAHQQPSDDEILNLVFQPGFSTAAQITHISGRGVGLDVVMRNIAALGGTLSVQSSPETGTRIDLHIPQAQLGAGI